MYTLVSVFWLKHCGSRDLSEDWTYIQSPKKNRRSKIKVPHISFCRCHTWVGQGHAPYFFISARTRAWENTQNNTPPGYQFPSRLSPIQDGTKTKWWLLRVVWEYLHRRVARRLDSAFPGVSIKSDWELRGERMLLSCVLHRALQINEGKGTHVIMHTIHCNHKG